MNRPSFESVDVENIVGEENMGVVEVIEEFESEAEEFIEECDTIFSGRYESLEDIEVSELSTNELTSFASVLDQFGEVLRLTWHEVTGSIGKGADNLVLEILAGFLDLVGELWEDIGSERSQRELQEISEWHTSSIL